jgi:hypothetical protein
MVGLAGVLVLSLGAVDAIAQSVIAAEGITKNEFNNHAPGVSFQLEELHEVDLYFDNIEPKVETTRIFQIDDPFNSFFLFEDCRFEATTVDFVGAFEHTDPPPHRYEYVFEFQGTAIISTEYPWGEGDFTVPNTMGRATVVDVLDPWSEPPPALRDSVNVEFHFDPSTEAPLFLCNTWVEVVVDVEP